MSTDVSTFIADLDGGVFMEKLSRVLSDVASAVIDHGEKGQVTIKLDMSRIATSHQVEIKHRLEFSRPTMRGAQSEHEVTRTPMYVGSKGALTFFPENQGQMFDKRGQVPHKKES